MQENQKAKYPLNAYKTAIIGASGYTGAELLRLLANHPKFEVRVATAHSLAGKQITEVYPHLSTYSGESFKSYDDAKEEIDKCELVFCGLPHGAAMEVLPGLNNKVVVDLGSDFRLENIDDYSRWYGKAHKAPDEVSNWTYGLSELFAEEIKGAKRIANPGCYATASILALAPLVKEDLLEGPVTIDAMSGTSGAGRVPSEKMHFSHVDENFCAYKVGKHQHTPEIEMALEKYCGKSVMVSLTAHLVPMVRGINATSSAALKKPISAEKLKDIYEKTYADSPFISILENAPQTKSVTGSNSVQIAPFVDARCQRVIVTSVIDNLVKGAAGQAIQNANLICGLEETAGLSTQGVYP